MRTPLDLKDAHGKALRVGDRVLDEVFGKHAKVKGKVAAQCGDGFNVLLEWEEPGVQNADELKQGVITGCNVITRNYTVITLSVSQLRVIGQPLIGVAVELSFLYEQYVRR